MNIAFLIMGHKNPTQLHRLFAALSNKSSRIFFHGDIKMSSEDYNTTISYNYTSVQSTSKRYNGELDKWSLVEIALELLRTAKSYESSKNIKFQYYYLLSGQDYPIIPVDQMIKELKEIYPKPIIDCVPWSKNKFPYGKGIYSLYTLKLHYRIMPMDIKSIKRNILKLYEKILIFKDCLLKNTTNDKLKSLGITIYGGSAWWLLSDQLVDNILSIVDIENDELSLLKNLYTPEECFFQTVVMMSPNASLVDYHNNLENQNCKTWAYFSDDIHPFKGHPYTVTMKKIEFINQIKGKYWIARKFDMLEDSRIFDEIDKLLHIRK